MGAGDSPADDSSPLKDLGSDGSTASQRRKLPKVQDPVDRETEDLSVSKFYQDRGNFLAAYLRAQDAVKTLPDDPEAHLRLAQTAEKMKKTDEAIAEYKAYLKLDPQGEKVKAAREALAELHP
jgi:outer membrane protein assembly factor BamD (BamD/ComL family)